MKKMHSSYDGVGEEARFIWIEGVAVDGTGTAWVLEGNVDPFNDPLRGGARTTQSCRRWRWP